MTSPQAYRQYTLGAARASFVIAAAALPLSTAATNTFAVLGFLAWAISGTWREATRAVAAEPAAWLGWALFGLLALGIAWSIATPREAGAALLKYRELVLFGIVLYVFADARWRARLLGGFLVGCLVLLALSFAVRYGWLDFVDERGFSSPENAVLLKNPITHGLMMSLLAYGCAVYALRGTRGQRWTFGVLAVLAAANAWLAVQSRTGYLVLVVLLLWLAWWRGAWRGLAAALVLGAALLAAAWQWAPVFQSRVAQAFEEARDYRLGPPGDTSIGSRFHFWKRSGEWLVQHPVLGAGTGGWTEAFYQATEGDDAYMHNRDRNHPHSEYVHLAVQLGPMGALLYAALMLVAFVRAARLEGEHAALARGLVIAFAVGSLFNDFMFDTTEGHLWALVGGALFAATPRKLF